VTNVTGDVYGVYAIGELDAYAVGNLFNLSAGGDAYGAFADGAQLWVSHGGFVPGTTYIPVGVT